MMPPSIPHSRGQSSLLGRAISRSRNPYGPRRSLATSLALEAITSSSSGGKTNKTLKAKKAHD